MTLSDTIPAPGARGAAQWLRMATRDEHEAVEALPAMRRLAEGRLDLAQYTRVLQRHLAALAPWERQLSDWLAALADRHWRYRSRSPLLRADLAALGQVGVPVPELAPLPAAEAYRWGMLYVIEGSQLGGRVIARALRQQLPEAGPALAYFDTGATEPSAWRSFQSRLEQALPDAGQRDLAVDGARAMFAHFHLHLSLETSA